ncbi:hypothetical protein F3C82_14625 [Bacteroides ovatus]|nr:hypothetical protein F3C82_14625 [Bacteroides ovatus]
MEIDILTSSIVLYCNELRKLMPKAGMRELYACCLRKFGVRMVIGRDQCYNIFRATSRFEKTPMPSNRHLVTGELCPSYARQSAVPL